MKIGWIAFVVTLGWSSSALADSERLGSMGTTSVAGQAGVALMNNDVPPNEPSKGRSLLAFAMIDRFVAPNVSVGISGGASSMLYEAQSNGTLQTTSSTSVQGALSFGYFVPLGDRAGFWPAARVGVAGLWSRYESQYGVYEAPKRAQIVSGGIDLQFTYAVSDHLYLRAVPGGVRAEFAKFEEGHARAFSAGFNPTCMFGLGGWF